MSNSRVDVLAVIHHHEVSFRKAIGGNTDNELASARDAVRDLIEAANIALEAIKDSGKYPATEHQLRAAINRARGDA